MKLGFLAPLALALVVGCGSKAADLSGKWSMQLGPTNMQISFNPDGTYSGTMNGMGAVGNVTGTYTLKGDMLEMSPPTVQGPNGAVTPPGGQMKGKLTAQGPNAYQLDVGSQKFLLTKMGP